MMYHTLEFLKSGVVIKYWLDYASILYLSTVLNIESISLTVLLLRDIDDIGQYGYPYYPFG